MKSVTYTPFTWNFLAACAAINFGVGFLVQALKLPIYLDSIGTLLGAVAVGPVAGVLVGVTSTILLTFVTAPTTLAYAVTAVVIAILAGALAKWGYLARLVPTALFGVLIGIVSAVVSAPITVYLFGGVSFAGADAVTAFLAATGKTILSSVVLGGLATDPLDKLVASVLALLLMKRLPARVKALLALPRR